MDRSGQASATFDSGAEMTSEIHVDATDVWELDASVVAELDLMPPELVADAIRALGEAAAVVFGPEQGGYAFALSQAGAHEFVERRDVLTNEAEMRSSHPAADVRDLLERTWDPAWRLALADWARSNEALLSDDSLLSEVHAAAEALSLGEYVAALAEVGERGDGAVVAGLLPCSGTLAAQSPGAARLCMMLWRVLSPFSPRPIAGSRDQRHPLPDRDEALGGLKSRQSASGPKGRRVTTQSEPPPLDAQARGDLLERNALGVLETLFDLDERSTGMPKPELRRQFSGLQFGGDLVIRTQALGTNTTCLVECKNYRDPIRLKDIAEKLIQAEDHFGSELLDYWVLISPHSDPSNELDLLVQRWNTERKHPFQIQIWSPQTRVKELLALSSSAFREIYGADRPVPNIDARGVVDYFRDRLRPWLRVPTGVATYLGYAAALVQPSEREWLPLLGDHIERLGVDAEGRPLDVPLREAILDHIGRGKPGTTALLTADFGEGKSFFTVAMCEELRVNFLENPSPASLIPFRFYLRDFRNIRSASEYLRQQLARVGIDVAEWQSLNAEWRVLVVLDGMDEMSVPQDLETTRANFDKVSDLLEELSGISVLVTSRPNFFGSERDRERFYDRLRRPAVFQLSQPSRQETIDHLRMYAETNALGGKLDRIKELYDPIGLAGKVLFLEMIKATLPDLPEDRFDERILYETYIENSFRRKVELLRDPDATLTDSELFDHLVGLLERVAVAVHSAGEGTVDLRHFLDDAGGAAHLLWKSATSANDDETHEDDAATRIGGRSMLRRLRTSGGDNEGEWLVDFFHRSMKEYFVARAISRALVAEDAFGETRSLLREMTLQPEIVDFFRLMSDDLSEAAPVLSSIAHSARLDANSGTLGGSAISLFNAVDGNFADQSWNELNLDGALLTKARLANVDFRGSRLRGASLVAADLTGADLRGCDMTDANLGTGEAIVSLIASQTSGTYFGLTAESGLIRVNLNRSRSMAFHDLSTSLELRWPQRLLEISEDILVAVGGSELAIARLDANTAATLAHFRIANAIRSVQLVDQHSLILLIGSESDRAEVVRVDLNTAEVEWSLPVPNDTVDIEWTSDSVITRSTSRLVWRVPDYEPEELITNAHITCHGPAEGSSAEGIPSLLFGTSDGWIGRAGIKTGAHDHDSARFTEPSPITALAVHTNTVMSATASGTLSLWDVEGPALNRVGTAERRLRCEGALVDDLRGPHERALLVSNGASGT
jgi:hypothetical protein